MKFSWIKALIIVDIVLTLFFSYVIVKIFILKADGRSHLIKIID